MSRSSKFIFGAMLGAAAAALLTPVNGKTARSRLQKAAAKSGFKIGAPRKTKSKT